MPNLTLSLSRFANMLNIEAATNSGSLLHQVRNNLLKIGLLDTSTFIHNVKIEIDINKLAQKTQAVDRFQLLMKKVLAGVDPISQLTFKDKPPAPHTSPDLVLYKAITWTRLDLLENAKSKYNDAACIAHELISLGLENIVWDTCDKISEAPEQYNTRAKIGLFSEFLHKKNTPNYESYMQVLTDLLANNKPENAYEMKMWRRNLLEAANESNNLIAKKTALAAILGEPVSFNDARVFTSTEAALEFINDKLRSELATCTFYKPKHTPTTPPICDYEQQVNGFRV